MMDELTPELNEVCYCGSGEKYKYCCEEKDRIPTADIRTIEFKVSDNSHILLELGAPLSNDDQEAFLAILDILSLETPQVDEKLIMDLQILAEKYHNPFVWENLHTTYILSGNLRQALTIENAIKTRFPNGFYTRFLKSARALEEKRLEDFEACFNHCANLPMLYPKRKVFHSSEAKMFHFQWLLYCTLISDLRRAESHFIPLQALLDEDDPALAQAREFMKALRKQRKDIVLSNRQFHPG